MGRHQAVSSLFEIGLLRRGCYSTKSLSSYRRFSSSNQWRQQQTQPQRPPQSRQLNIPPAIEQNPVALNKHEVKQFTPKPLKRPLGLQYAPEEGQNTGVDTRTLRQRGGDLVDKEKYQQRQSELKPYYREWHRMNYHSGKVFICNPRLFKEDFSLYFPNLFGRTLLRSNPMQHTTPVLRGKISLVRVFASLWAESQTVTFVGEKENPELQKIIADAGPLVQKVDINNEDNWLKALLVRLFMGSMRRKMPSEQHGRYFLVRKGFTNYLKDQIGMLNGKVGYVYLLDENCKIRWAGSSIAGPEELESLNRGLQKLVSDKRASQEMPRIISATEIQKAAQTA
ncbi:F1F0 ATP synthase assembly protein Atp10, putative [Trichophyton benhamiae CBS 112371]|uniref:F1F0 ATP synthase assembly protein Atp10, putative n=1 Tax=Arthroderma benhamiae (strain ATCC MYA-4681 / CBS 112371) TaxID=663331 RepID=D4B3Z0_ARTBC|nr:F1F0 ATP synthase assembly protein Atp10, putative [Trichophyton benhamiae CBS 112371]EFE29838.1 F1F0 ATP synthase assembly protein Atp10, putative [Trichophyton benhamiae CBS 112371]